MYITIANPLSMHFCIPPSIRWLLSIYSYTRILSPCISASLRQFGGKYKLFSSLKYLFISRKKKRRCIPRYWIALFIPYRIKSITHIWRSNPPTLSVYFIIRIALFIPYRIKSITHIWRSNPPTLSVYFIIRIALFTPYRIKSITHIWRSNPP